MALANKTKANYKAAVSGAQTLQAVIKSTVEWGWANNGVAQNDLANAITALQTAVAGDTFTK
eukprot:2358021-Pyramimonas_sp.AAC.1